MVFMSFSEAKGLKKNNYDICHSGCSEAECRNLLLCHGIPVFSRKSTGKNRNDRRSGYFFSNPKAKAEVKLFNSSALASRFTCFSKIPATT